MMIERTSGRRAEMAVKMWKVGARYCVVLVGTSIGDGGDEPVRGLRRRD